MSSILRALKKLESDPRHQAETRPLDAKFVPLADTSPAKTPAAMIMMVLGGGIVCGLVILAGWWLFSERTRPAPVAPQVNTQHNTQAKVLVPLQPQGAAPPAIKAAAAEPVKPVAEIPAVQIPDAAAPAIVAPSPPAVVQKGALDAAGSTAESSPPQPAVAIPEIITQVPGKEAGIAVTSLPEASATVNKIQLPVLNDPEMKLQAITWSKDPQKRIVVINNRILRQGEVVAGYRIDTINQDDVILNEAGEKWQILFRIK